MRTDQDIDRLVRGRDPVGAGQLTDPAVTAALEALLPETAAAPSTPRRPRRRRLLRPALGALALAVPVIAVALVLLTAGGRHSSTTNPADHGNKASHPHPTPAVFPTARQYQYVRVADGSIVGVGGKGWMAHIEASQITQDWFKANGSGRELIVDTGRRFLTAADAATARAHHTSVSSILPNQSADGVYPAGGIGWPLYSTRGLPERPQALTAALERRLPDHHLAPSPAFLFETLGRTLFVTDSPGLRAAMYDALMRLPGVQQLGRRADRLGRTGVAVAIVDDGVRQELIYDPATSNPLETESVQLTRAPHGLGVRSDTVINYTVFLARGIVNSIDDLPGGGRLPYRPCIGGGCHR